uniref:Zinc finger BED domain-containing protein RICESLEEPER 2 n=1 Tax=Tanacetum cinerariifolium TaxID=118510 RepID=A0A699GWS7_TANCI|nr:zinc finger BED domain-containing protein RICESLEEPER 2 [Tanacetum cinerariifolium]
MSRDESLFVYNPDVLREQFAGLVIQRGLPFSHFDDEQTTRVFKNHLQPKYNHVSRTTIKRDAMKLWVAAKQAIIDGFLNLNTNKMMKRVIVFEDFSVLHAGGALARLLRKVFVNFNLEDKIMSITLDNASNNTSGSGASSSRASGMTQMNQLLNRLKEHTNKKARSDPSLSSKYERYVHSDFVTHLENNEFAAFDLLGFWKAKESIFLVLSRIAMDIISVQATSVASEFAFSTSERVLSIRRTRLTPTSLEMCICLKDQLDAQKRKQDKSGLENPVDFEEEILDAEVQQNEAILLSDEEIALDVASSEGTMSGSGSGGEEGQTNRSTVVNDDQRWSTVVKLAGNLLILPEAAKLEKQIDAKLTWLLEKYYYRSQESVGCSSSHADLYLTEKELHQLHLDEEVLRETLEEQAMDAKAREEKIRQKQADDDEFFLEFEMMRVDSDYESSD